MISSIIYETVDFVYTIGRITLSVIKKTYSLFSSKKNESPENLRIRLLEERIFHLEKHV